MISYTGISIFLFGNKLDKDGKIVFSNGMQQEYEISESQGNILIPVGVTDFISRKLWEDTIKVHKDEEPYKSLEKEFKSLGDAEWYNNPNGLIKLIVEIVKKVTN